jgi:hypothetical protein
VPRCWRKLHNEEPRFITCYYYGKVRDDEVGRGCNMHGELRNVYKILVGRSEGN